MPTAPGPSAKGGTPALGSRPLSIYVEVESLALVSSLGAAAKVGAPLSSCRVSTADNSVLTAGTPGAVVVSPGAPHGPPECDLK